MISEAEKIRIHELIKHVETKLRREERVLFSIREKEKKFRVGKDLPIPKSKNPIHIKEYCFENKIKTSEGKINKISGWSPEYLREALNTPYKISNKETQSQLIILKERIKLFFDDKRNLKKFLKKKKKQILKYVDDDFGLAYINAELRKKNFQQYKSREDFFWFISEYYNLRPLQRQKQNFFTPENNEYPFVDVSFEKLNYYETAFWLLPLIKNILKTLNGEQYFNLEDPPFNTSSPLFNKRGEKIFYSVLIKSGAITLENHKIILGKNFKGICGCLFELLIEPKYSAIKSTTTKREIIVYLNQRDTYNGTFSNPKSGVIANPSTIEKHLNSITKILKSYFPSTD